MAPVSLITRADDLGSSHAANEAILQVAEAGFVKNISVMAVCPHLEEAAEMLSGRKDVSFGLHACITSEWDRVLWGPLASRERVPHLIDARGAMYQTVDALAAAKPAVEEIMHEYRCQLETLRRVGFHVTYLDSHMMPELQIPGLREAMSRMAEEEGLVDHSPFYRMFPTDLKQLAKQPELFRRTLQSGIEGTYLMIMHPACYGEEMLLTGNRKNSGETVASQREADRRFMTDPAILAACKDFGVRLLRYEEAAIK